MIMISQGLAGRIGHFGGIIMIQNELKNAYILYFLMKMTKKIWNREMVVVKTKWS